MGHHTHRAEGTFGSAFGGSVGCIFGIVFALAVLILVGFLGCAGVFGVGCFATKEVVESGGRAIQEAEARKKEQDEAKAKADAKTKADDAEVVGKSKPPAAKPEPKIPGVGEWVEGVDLRIQIGSATVDAPVFMVAGKEKPGEPALIIHFRLENGKARPLDYRRPTEGFTAIDSKGKSLKLRTVRGVYVKGDVADRKLKPTEAVVDIIVFDPPSDDANHVDLVFPSMGDWSKGGQTFRIPASAWKK